MKYLRFFGLAGIFLGFISAGCAIPENQGRLVRSFEVAKLVEEAIVLPDHTYYYTGPEARPDAIIAIDNRYELKSKYWIRVDNVEEKLADWNYFIDNKWRYSKFYEGAQIMTPDSEQAGIWYSRYDHTVVRYPDPNSIIVYKPYVPVQSDKPFTFHSLE